uniref:Uncharacterized protein n=1 Tax=Populus trichocarpa TaxID=3694 RepID=A0A3N7HWG8_POPTR
MKSFCYKIEPGAIICSDQGSFKLNIFFCIF